jgi:hypothetical protein
MSNILIVNVLEGSLVRGQVLKKLEKHPAAAPKDGVQ